MDLEVELLERKVRLFVSRAELVEKRDQPAGGDVRDDVSAVQEKWNSLVKLVDGARQVQANSDRLQRRAAEVDVALLAVSRTFTTRRYALAWSLLSPSVRPSVRLSRWCIVSRRLKISSNFFLGLVAPSF